MKTQIHLIQSALGDLFAQVNLTGQLTLADRYGLMAAILNDSLSYEERRCVDRLLRAVLRGRIAVVDEISAIARTASYP
ncbi:MAG: hypothetical protein ACP5D7_14280 [Limnospira sp.]